MIQRIQTLWLVLAACCMAVCFAVPMAKYSGLTTATTQEVVAQLDLVAKDNSKMMEEQLNMAPTIHYSQKVSGFKTWPLIAVLAVGCVVAVVSVFMYKNRVAQVRMVAFGLLVMVVYLFLVFFWAVDAYGKAVGQAMAVSELSTSWAAGAFLPMAAVVLLFLAQRAIKSDEAKVRAADRLR